MYQINTDSRLQIQVVGDLCKVVDENGGERFCGNYTQCVEWLSARGIKTR
jgi:hypothetical protein